MRIFSTFFAILTIALLIPSVLLAQMTGDVVHSFQSPSSGPTGLAWDSRSSGANLWHCDQSRPGTMKDPIYRLNPRDGSVVSEMDSQTGQPSDLAWDGAYLWCANEAEPIFKLATDGTVLGQFSGPYGVGIGITWANGHLWVSNHNGMDGDIFEIDTNIALRAGNCNRAILSRIDLPEGANTRGLAFDGESIWCSDQDAATLTQVTLDGRIIQTVDSPGTNPRGLAFDGEYLWCADLDTDMIYRICARDYSSVPLLVSSPPEFYYNTILISWTPVPEADHYILECQIGGDTASLELTDNYLRLIAADEAQWSCFVALGTMQYRISALDATDFVLDGPTDWADCTCY